MKFNFGAEELKTIQVGDAVIDERHNVYLVTEDDSNKSFPIHVVSLSTGQTVNKFGSVSFLNDRQYIRMGQKIIKVIKGKDITLILGG